MKSFFRIYLLSFLFISGMTFLSCSNSDPSTPEPEQPEPSPDDPSSGGSGGDQGDDTGSTNDPSDDDEDAWTLLFEDDFDTDDSTEPDPDKWVLCERGDKTWNRNMSESYKQAYIENGSLFLIGELVDGKYLTGGIETRGKFDFQYGKVECRARFARRPKGNHTGIWMMPAPPAEEWPKSGEIDIMEHLNDESIIYQTVHNWYADDMGHSDKPKAQGTAEIDNQDWNIYGIIWNADSITYTVNGEKYLTYPNLHLSGDDAQYQWPFDHPFYLILSQSLGGEDTWEGPIDNSELPAEFEIDYIKVWQRSEE